MKDGFEKYVERNREDFEKGSPSAEVWQKIRGQLDLYHQKKARVIKTRRTWLSIAAGLLLFIAMGLVLLKKDKPVVQIARMPVKRENTDPLSNKKSARELVQAARAINRPLKKRKDTFDLTGKEYRQSIYYYTRLVEIRQGQIRRLQIADPELYKESRKAIDTLDAVYGQLKNQLPGSINQEKVLRSMIENLQMQERILTNQLQLIREIQSNNRNHEKQTKGI
jgi:hypothetical protein